MSNNFCRMLNKFEFPAADIQSKQRKLLTTNQHEAQIRISWAFYWNYSAKHNKRAFMILVTNWLSRLFLVFICFHSVFLDSLDIWMHSTQNVFRVQNILASGNNTNISGHLQSNTSFNSRLQKKGNVFQLYIELFSWK